MSPELEKELIKFKEALEKDIKFLTKEKKRNYNKRNNIFVINWDFELEDEANQIEYIDKAKELEETIKDIKNQYNTDREQKLVEMILSGERTYKHICTKSEFNQMKQQVKNHLIKRIYEKD